MRTLLTLAAILALSAQCVAADLRFIWDPSLTLGITNYVLYAHTNALNKASLASAAVRVNVGTNVTASIEGIQPGRWWFGATAMKDGMESDLSNTINVEVPAPPANMRTVVIQYGGTLTNFYDVGFFRLRLP